MTAAEPLPSSRSTDLAWAAGLFDGEGCFHKRPDSAWSWVAAVEMTDKETVARFAEILGSPERIRPKRRRQEAWNDLWVWSAYGVDAVAVARALSPYMITKRARAEEVIRVFEERPIRVCAECGTSFRGDHRFKRFCSSLCRDRGRAKRVKRVTVDGKRIRIAA